MPKRKIAINPNIDHNIINKKILVNMKKTASIFNLSALVFGIILTGMVFTSCGEDDVEGCTDPAAENYNAEATVDDGTCTFASEKFLGNYTGTLGCAGILAAISTDSLAFSIANSPSGVTNELLVVLESGAAAGVGIVATASGNTLTVDNYMLDDLPLDLTGDGNGNMTDLTIDGSLTISGNTLDGSLTLSITDANVPGLPYPLVDTCPISGTK